MFIFFFSSRRRHTRYIGDWSSDVCSSDLCSDRLEHPHPARSQRCAREPGLKPGPRSEERRVGKEGRSRGATYRKKKKGKKMIMMNRQAKVVGCEGNEILQDAGCGTRGVGV